MNIDIKIADEFLNLRNKNELNWKINIVSAKKILDIATKWYKYLPNNLNNKNYFNHLKTSLQKGIKFPSNPSSFTSISSSIENYLVKTDIKAIKWNVQASPKEWNAPLVVTLRWNVIDPTWTPIPNHNYTWWIFQNWKRKILWNWISLKYIFKKEWKFSVFLDVKIST